MNRSSLTKLKQLQKTNLLLFSAFFVVSFCIGIFLFFELSKGKEDTDYLRYDPYQLLLSLKNRESAILLVDIRNEKDFQKGHIKTAVSFPLYSTDGQERELNNTIVDTFLKQFKNIKGKKTVIIYADFAGTPKTIEFAEALNKRHVGATSLAVGWNEWRHFRNLWVPESAWNEIRIEEFVTSDIEN